MNEGRYLGTCKDLGMDTSVNKTLLLDVIFEVSQIASNGNWEQVSPFDRHVRIYLSPAAWPMSQQKLDSLDFNGDFRNPEITTEWVELICKHEDYKGQTRERWELAEWGNQERLAPPDDELRKLSARYKTAQAANKKPPGKPAAPPVQGPDDVPGYEDKDIPF